MKAYARIEDGAVAEIIHTTGDIEALFHPALQWVEVTGRDLRVGWRMGADGAWAAPPVPALAMPLPPSLSDLVAELAALKADVAQLRGH